MQENELTAAGYVVLTKSREAGVDLFVKKKKKSLFVHFQGHPEYAPQTLLKEYRRDIKRFVRGERETYPTMPYSYFDSSAAALLESLRDRALSDRCEEIIESFPESVVSGLKNGWQTSAIGVYRNWLNYIISCKVEARAFSSFAPAGRQRCQPPVNNEIA